MKGLGLVLLISVMCLTIRKTTCSPDEKVSEKKSSKRLKEVLLILKEQEAQISSLTQELKAIQNERSSKGTSYVRWGRKNCPGDAQLVYSGSAAGSHYTHTGAAANYLCLPADPNYVDIKAGFQPSGRIHGAEYQTYEYPNWRHLHDHDVPCAVCRIPRTDVLMVPGKNVCHKNYVLEYKGFLMSGYHSHAAASEFVCVDDKQETLHGGEVDKNGKLFYFVESVCGSLDCPPYKNGAELTCAVCSFSPNAN